IAIYSYLSIIQYNGFHTGHWDLAGFDQAIWNTIQGRILDTTMYGHNFLGEHFSPMLLILAPFYLIWQDPRMLLFLQSLFLGLGAIPVFLIAKDKLKHNLLSLSFSFAYLFHPFISRVNLFEFHEICLAPFFLLFTFYFLQRRIWLLYFIFFFFSLMVKEDVSLIITALGIYSFFKTNKRIGIITFIIGIFWAYLSVSVLIPYIRKATETGAWKETYGYFGRLGLGESLSEIIKNLILKPQNTLKMLFLPANEKLATIILLVLPCGFLSILSPVLLIALLEIILHFMAGWDAQYLLAWHYSAPIFPFAIVSGIYGLFFLSRRLKIPSFSFSLLMLTTSILSNYYFSFSALNLVFHNPSYYLYDVNNHKTILSFPQKEKLKIYYQLKKKWSLFKTIIYLIPKDSSISVEDNLLAHFSQRQTSLYVFPNFQDAEYVVLNVHDFGNWILRWEKYENYKKGMDLIQKDSRFQVFFKDEPGGGIIVFGRKNQRERIIKKAKMMAKFSSFLSETHFILGSIYLCTNNLKEAEEELKIALELDPNNTFINQIFEECKKKILDKN
ncbi:MAG: DUF2079 domain-containing protein, partial [bacterium]